MKTRKTANSLTALARLGLVALGMTTLALSAYANEDYGRDTGRNRGHREAVEHRDHEGQLCCKRGSKRWWVDSRRDCRRHGGQLDRVATPALSVCAIEDHGRNSGHDRGHREAVERRNHDGQLCCKRGSKRWWVDSRRDCRRHGGQLARPRYCRPY